MYRVFWIAAVGLAVLATLTARTASATDVLDPAKIKAGLRTTTIEEGGFVDRVVNMARAGKLPPDMVEATFQWARKKPFQHRFQYFKRGLTVRAAKAGIAL